MKTEGKTVVVFRRWHCGGVCALFPYEPNDLQGLYCLSYEHVGQHGSADYDGMISRTKPVKADDPDVRDLVSELKRIGYDLDIRTRATNAHYKRRVALES